jgi:hypothetical protein
VTTVPFDFASCPPLFSLLYVGVLLCPSRFPSTTLQLIRRAANETVRNFLLIQPDHGVERRRSRCSRFICCALYNAVLGLMAILNSQGEKDKSLMITSCILSRASSHLVVMYGKKARGPTSAMSACARRETFPCCLAAGD